MLDSATLKTTLVLVAVGGAVIAARPHAAAACEPPICWPGYVTPEDGTTVPADVPALLWRPLYNNYEAQTPDPANVDVVDVDAPKSPPPFRAVSTGDGENDYLLILDGPLTPGDHYRVTDHSVCKDDPDVTPGPDVSFVAGPSSPLPKTLGTLHAAAGRVGALTVGTLSGTCNTTATAAQVDIALAPSTEAAPWVDALHFTTVVDGKPWGSGDDLNATYPPGASWIGRGKDRLYALCGSGTDGGSGTFPGVGEGSHTVLMRATLPGTALVLRTPPITVKLDCGEASGGGGCAIGGDTGSPAGSATLAVLVALALLWRRRRGRALAPAPTR